MRRGIRSRRSWIGAATGLLGLGVAAAACLEGPTGPGGLRFGQIWLRAAFVPGETPEQLGVSIDSAYVKAHLVDAGRVAVDTIVQFDSSAAELTWLVSLDAESDSVQLTVELRYGPDSMYAGSTAVAVVDRTVELARRIDVPVVYIGAAVPTAITVEPDSAHLPDPQATHQFTTIVLDHRGDTIAGYAPGWHSTDTAVATIDSTGLLRARTAGELSVIATAGPTADTAHVRIDPEVLPPEPVVDSVDVNPDSTAFTQVPDTARLTATAFDSTGAVIPAVFTWSSLDLAVATVDTTGLVTAVAQGNTGIVAESNGLADTAFVSVDTTSIPQPPVVDSVSVTPDSVGFTQVPDTARLTAVAFDSTGAAVPGAAFTWMTLDAAVATVDTTGLVTAVAQGSTAIIAESNGLADTAFVSVDTTTVPQPPVVDSVQVTPDSVAFTQVPDTARLTAVAFDSTGAVVPGAAFTWMTLDAAVATVDTSGLVTAVAEGNTGIIAESNGLADTAFVSVDTTTVPQPPVVDSVFVTPDSVAFTQVPDTARLTAVAFDSTGAVVPGAAFTWMSLDAAVATVDTSGLVTAVAEGNTGIIAESNGLADTAFVSVDTTTIPQPPVVDSVSVTPDSVVFTQVPDTARLAAVAFDSTGAIIPAVFTWISLDTAVATVDTTGLVTAVAQGNTGIIATTNGRADTAIVTVDTTTVPQPPVVDSVSVTPDSVAFTQVPDTARLTATAFDSTGAVVPGAAFTWMTLDAAVATVDTTGLVTAVAQGNTGIIAESNGLADTAFVSVDTTTVPLPPVVDSVVVSPELVQLSHGDTTRLAAVAFDSTGTPIPGATFQWSALDSTVATVDSAGLVRAIGNGETLIVVTAGNRADTALVEVAGNISARPWSEISGDLRPLNRPPVARRSLAQNPTRRPADVTPPRLRRTPVTVRRSSHPPAVSRPVTR